jgi:hypothetical protein
MMQKLIYEAQLSQNNECMYAAAAGSMRCVAISPRNNELHELQIGYKGTDPH